MVPYHSKVRLDCLFTGIFRLFPCQIDNSQSSQRNNGLTVWGKEDSAGSPETLPEIESMYLQIVTQLVNM